MKLNINSKFLTNNPNVIALVYCEFAGHIIGYRSVNSIYTRYCDDFRKPTRQK